MTSIAYMAAWRKYRQEQPRTERCIEAFRQWGVARGLRFNPDGLELTGVVDGLRVILRARFDEADSGMPYLITMASIGDSVMPVLLQIVHVGGSRTERLARQSVTTGDPEIDARFKLWCDPRGMLHEVLHDRLRRAMLALEPTEFFYDHGVVEVCWNELFDQIEAPMHDLDAAFEVVTAALRGRS